MIYTRLKGRLGNNLFQIAAAASLARQHNDDFCIVVPDLLIDKGISTSDDEIRSLQKSIFRKVDVIQSMPSDCALFQEQAFAYQPVPYTPNMAISGYFQSEKYFDQDLVKELFAIDNETKSYIETKYGALLAKKPTSIHIRRGDYLSNLDFHPICSLNYFKNAMRLIGGKTPFLIVTNDIAWCKKRFRGENIYFTERESAVVDLYLQSMCENNIISNSSFSWWGAWLNNNPTKKVIYPKPWFGISATQIDNSDLIPSDWISLENRMSLFLRIFARFRKMKRDIYQRYWKKLA